jgi:7-keto-8-aminopelargonate synthetase-like enzyme
LYSALLADATFHELLLAYDRDLADIARDAGCGCGGVLHSAKYPRKPRPRLGWLRPEYHWRFSYCCAVDGSRHFARGGARPITVWCSNDYLGMGQNPAVLAAMHAALDAAGAGSRGTRNISARRTITWSSRLSLPTCTERRRRCLFTSAYVANDTTLATLQKLLPGCLILSNQKNHASMIAGSRNAAARSASGATTTSPIWKPSYASWTASDRR